MKEALKYLETHEWVRVEGDIATVGISEFASDEIGGIVFVDLPRVGEKLVKEASFGAVESVKAVSDLYTPVTGEVVEVNEALLDAPELLNDNPLVNWIIKLKISDIKELDTLLDEKAYAAFCASEK